MPPSSTPLKHKKPYRFLMFSGVRERMHWEQMGEKIRKTTSLQVQTNLNYTGNGSGSNYQIQFGFIIPKQ